MLWIAVLFIFVLVMSHAVYTKKKGTGLVLAAVGDDSDMKIVPPSGAKPSLEDAGEKAAQEFVLQKENGNIDKAYALGKKIADVLFEENSPVLTFCQESTESFERLQRKILFAFVTDTVLNQELPSVLAETASQEFLAQIQKRDLFLSEKINDPQTLSYYLLGAKNGRERVENIGRAFALLCGDQENTGLCSLGECLCREYSRLCTQMIEEARFCE